MTGLNLNRYAMAVLGDTLFVHGGRVTTQEESLGTLLAYHLDSSRWEWGLWSIPPVVMSLIVAFGVKGALTWCESICTPQQPPPSLTPHPLVPLQVGDTIQQPQGLARMPGRTALPPNVGHGRPGTAAVHLWGPHTK